VPVPWAGGVRYPGRSGSPVWPPLHPREGQPCDRHRLKCHTLPARRGCGLPAPEPCPATQAPTPPPLHPVRTHPADYNLRWGSTNSQFSLKDERNSTNRKTRPHIRSYGLGPLLYGRAANKDRAEGPRMAKLRREMEWRLLGNGYCTRHPEMRCESEMICETCAFFWTTEGFLPTLQQ
jgi:hypothetical protein